MSRYAVSSMVGCFATTAVLLVCCAMPAHGAPQSVDDFLGTWAIEVTVGDRVNRSKLSLFRDDSGALRGEWDSPQIESELRNVTYQDGRIAFDRVLGDSVLANEIRLDGDSLVGKMSTRRGDLEYTGTREVAPRPGTPEQGP